MLLQIGVSTLLPVFFRFTQIHYSVPITLYPFTAACFCSSRVRTSRKMGSQKENTGFSNILEHHFIDIESEVCKKRYRENVSIPTLFFSEDETIHSNQRVWGEKSHKTFFPFFPNWF